MALNKPKQANKAIEARILFSEEGMARGLKGVGQTIKTHVA